MASSQMVMGAHQNKLIQGGHCYYDLLPHLLSLLVASQHLSLTNPLGGGCKRAWTMNGWMEKNRGRGEKGKNYRGKREEVREKVRGR